MNTNLRKRTFLALTAMAAFVATQLGSCSSVWENRDPMGELFPAVVGESLEGDEIRLPESVAGRPTVLLVGYVQDAQFDADRWLFGLLQAEIQAQVYEVPTIKGLFPSVISGTIDSGMRSGIPSEDWQSVVTVYGSDAEKIVEMTGNERPRNIRVFLLDNEGRVRWFHDRGFSAGKLLELSNLAAELSARSTPR